MKLNEAIKILNNAGFLVETRRPGMNRQVFKPTGDDFEAFMNDNKIKGLYDFAVKEKKDK